ncbi:MAG: response regulator transcription factor [Alicyclobacillus sp.]|nr:response regulator transcription factor [Alicyclobacillus sp.]
METTLLLVDDEPKVLDVMKPFLQGEGFRVFTASTGPEALQMVEECKPQLVVLDWMLPGLSGLDVCRELRKSSSVGIIMLTARTEEADKIVGLEVGADDYLTKPFSLRELVARIRSVLRRSAGEQDQESTVLHRGDLKIDEARFRVWKRGQEVVLTPTEFKILFTLAASPGVVYSRLQLLQAAIGESYLNYERTIDTHISHLRKKIEDDPAQPVYIQTVYGIGYRFGEQV